jgi:hypothetical protein
VLSSIELVTETVNDFLTLAELEWDIDRFHCTVSYSCLQDKEPALQPVLNLIFAR